DFGSRAPECYKATVNESETINEAKHFLRFPAAGKACGTGIAGFKGFRSHPSSNGAQLGSVRKRWIALRARPGDFARPQFPHSRPFLSVPHRTFRRRQDLAAE